MLLPAAALAQLPAGREFQVNTTTLGVQAVHARSVAMAPNGDFVVTWESRPPPPGVIEVLGQRFDAMGARLGSEFRVNSSIFQGSWGAYPAVDSAGNFIVVWAGGSLPNLDVQGQRFDASGARRGAEFRVNTISQSNSYRPSITADDAGNFVVVWHSENGDGSSRGVLGQRYDATGAALGNEFRVNTYTTEKQDFPSIDSTANGDFVVVWKSYRQDGSGYGIFGQRYQSSGVPRGGEFRVNAFTTGHQANPVVAVDATGRFVVAWISYGQDGDDRGIFAQRYDASGNPQGPEFQVSSYTTGYQSRPSVDAAPDGSYVIAWYSNGQDGSSHGVFGQRFDSSGSRRGGEFQINTYTTSTQSYPGVAAGPGGRFVVVWDSDTQDGSFLGVFGQRLGGLEPVGLAVDTMAGATSDGNGVLEAGEAVMVAPSWLNANAVAHTFGGAASGFTGPGAPGDPVYAIADATASYGTAASGATAGCTATSDCYAMGTTLPSTRPSQHWDGSFQENILPATHVESKTWLVHFGESFADVPRTSGFYRFIETLLHHGVTGGCSATDYCPATATTRDQMAVFVLVAKEGAGYVPPACTTPVFADVPASNPFCRWIEELSRRGVVSGCGGGNYCPASAVTREQMAVFVLRTLDPTLSPPACTVPLYNDVPASSGFCPWIEELTRRAVVTGCGGGNYCPTAAVTREQMGVFLSVTFGLTLYGP